VKKCFFILFFLIILCGCDKKKEETVVKEPFPVNAIIAKDSPIQDKTISAVLLQGIKKATLYSQTVGTISWVSAKLGDDVKSGQVLLLTENSVQAANLKQAEGALEEAQLNFLASERLFNNSNGISKAEYIRSQNMFFAAQTALASAKKTFDDTKVVAPFDGIITNVNDVVQKGNNISIAQPLFSIIDITHLKANVSIGEKEIGLIKKDAVATVKIAAVDTELSGAVSAVSSGSDFQTGAFTVEVIFENQNLSVKDGMSGVVSIETGQKRHGIIIPSNAIINNRSVYVAQDDKAHNLPIEFEQTSAGKAWVKKGISQGDTVIISGITQISQNDTVSVNIVE
jgi:membrane fusion protein (multidrug efflux system)